MGAWLVWQPHDTAPEALPLTYCLIHDNGERYKRTLRIAAKVKLSLAASGPAVSIGGGRGGRKGAPLMVL